MKLHKLKVVISLPKQLVLYTFYFSILNYIYVLRDVSSLHFSKFIEL